MARKVFISFLGYSYYIPCSYTREFKNNDGEKETFKSEEVNYIQIATLDFYQKFGKWTEDDKAYIVLTKGAEENNWKTNDKLKHRDTGETSPGLCSCFETKKEKEEYFFKVIPITNIPDGNNEEQLFRIFNTVFEKIFKGIKEGEETELYFDVTHSFRSLPMLALVMANYVKFLRNVKVKSITYGNYEARTKVGTKEIQTDSGLITRDEYEAPIIDLTPLSQIQDWTFAAADMIRNGNSSQLYKLANSDNYLVQMLRIKKSLNMNDRLAEQKIQAYITALHNMLLNMRLCRLPQVMDYSTMDEVNKAYNNASSQLDSEKQYGVISPLPPILDKVKETFKDFRRNRDLDNGYLAAQWCCEHQLYQQAITILHENVITDMCRKLGVDDRIYEQRHLAAGFLRNRNYKDEDLKKVDKENAETFKRNMNNKEVKTFVNALQQVAKWTHRKRNTFDHAAMSKSPIENEKGMVIKNNNKEVVLFEIALSSRDIEVLETIIIPYVLNPTEELKIKIEDINLEEIESLKNKIK